MKIKNFAIATVGAASLALVLSACGEAPVANNSNANVNKAVASPTVAASPVNVAPVNGANNAAPVNGANNASHSNAPVNKPAENKAAVNANAAPTKKP